MIWTAYSIIKKTSRYIFVYILIIEYCFSVTSSVTMLSQRSGRQQRRHCAARLIQGSCAKVRHVQAKNASVCDICKQYPLRNVQGAFIIIKYNSNIIKASHGPRSSVSSFSSIPRGQEHSSRTAECNNFRNLHPVELQRHFSNKL